MSLLDPWTRLVPGTRVLHRHPGLAWWRGSVARDENGYAWTWSERGLGGALFVFVEWDHMGQGAWYLAPFLMEERKWTEQWRGFR